MTTLFCGEPSIPVWGLKPWGIYDSFKLYINNGFPIICTLHTILENTYFILRNPPA